jgi:hypothetical protein
MAEVSCVQLPSVPQVQTTISLIWRRGLGVLQRSHAKPAAPIENASSLWRRECELLGLVKTV